MHTVTLLLHFRYNYLGNYKTPNSGSCNGNGILIKAAALLQLLRRYLPLLGLTGTNRLPSSVDGAQEMR